MFGSTAYELNFRDGVFVLLFANALAATIVAFFATFGPKTGMRQMIIARYSFGYYGTMLLSFLVCFFFTRFIYSNLKSDHT